MPTINLENQIMLKYVDAIVATTGEIKAKDIAKAFNICKNTSLRIIKLYNQAQPGNLRLVEQGLYTKCSTFKPKFLGDMAPNDFFQQLDSIRAPFQFTQVDQAPDWCY